MTTLALLLAIPVALLAVYLLLPAARRGGRWLALPIVAVIVALGAFALIIAIHLGWVAP